LIKRTIILLHAYTKGFNGAKELRDSVMEAKNYSEVKKLIEKFL